MLPSVRELQMLQLPDMESLISALNVDIGEIETIFYKAADFFCRKWTLSKISVGGYEMFKLEWSN